MDKFEEAICGHNPLYKEGLQDKYYQGAKWAWQSRQAELDQLNEVLDERTKEWLEAIKLGTYFQEVAKPLKDEVDFLKAQLGIKRDQINGFESEIKKTWQALEEKDKRIEELERSCISYKNQRDDNAQKLMVKSVHYSSIQEELAKLKDRLELAHHLATQSTWSSLKQLKKVVKALRGEHE
jgi:chromosome segregation ATPase